jgi:hypothetical protein
MAWLGWRVGRAGRALYMQADVRAEVVELVAEVVELALLGGETAGGRDGSVALERAMHAFMDGVLLRFAWFDELGIDAKLDEPDGESGKASQGTGGEGDAIVGADAVGQAKLVEEPGEVLLGELEGDGGVGVHPEQVAGGQIADRERKAVMAIPEAELALVVGGPDVVGPHRDGLGTTGVSAAEATLRAGKASPSQNAAGGGG